jgi:hypothetical protein
VCVIEKYEVTKLRLLKPGVIEDEKHEFRESNVPVTPLVSSSICCIYNLFS